MEYFLLSLIRYILNNYVKDIMAITTITKTKFKVGDRVWVSPQVTNRIEWVQATITEVQNNPFVGIVITVKTDDNTYFFEKQDMFKSTEQELCLQ